MRARAARWSVVAAVVAAVVSVAACEETSPPPPPVDTAGDSGTDSGADTATDNGADPGTDSGPGDTGDDSGPAEGEFVLGVNVTGTNTPEFFSELPEGGDLTIEYGPQGLWMVVLAFKTRNIWGSKDRLTIIGSCWIGDDNRGELALAKQPLSPAADGWDYYYNFFLVVDEIGAAGNDAEIRLSIEDDTANKLELTHAVHLVGGP